MFESGFLGTRAALFMDIVTVIVVLLPFLVTFAIGFAKVGNYKVHGILQTVIFFVSVAVLAFFEFGVRVSGGFNVFVQSSGVSHSYAKWVLIFHIAIAVFTLIMWTKTLLTKKRPKKHKKDGIITFAGISLTSLTGLWVYFILFVY